MEPELLAAGGIITALLAVVGRILLAESPYRRMNQDLEDDAKDMRDRMRTQGKELEEEREKLRESQDREDLWRRRAYDAGWRAES